MQVLNENFVMFLKGILLLLCETMHWLIHFNFSIERTSVFKSKQATNCFKNNKKIKLSLFFHTFLQLQIHAKKLHCS